MVESGNKSPLRESVYKNMQHEHKKRPTLQQVYNSKIQLSRKTLQPPPSIKVAGVLLLLVTIRLKNLRKSKKFRDLFSSVLERFFFFSSLNGINRGRSQGHASIYPNSILIQKRYKVIKCHTTTSSFTLHAKQ